MNTLIAILLAAVLQFTETYKSEYENALEFYRQHPEVKQQLIQSGLTDDEATMAMAIVAPELAVHYVFSDWAQTKTLQLIYVQYDHSDFSIGFFQIKPSFIEYLEKRVAVDEVMKKQYGDVVIRATDVIQQRKVRVARLTSLKWQTKYLCLFMQYAKQRKDDFKSPEERVAYWATLYNAGFKVSDQTIAKLRKIKGFPTLRRQFNYSDIALIFYKALKEQEKK